MVQNVSNCDGEAVYHSGAQTEAEADSSSGERAQQGGEPLIFVRDSCEVLSIFIDSRQPIELIFLGYSVLIEADKAIVDPIQPHFRSAVSHENAWQKIVSIRIPDWDHIGVYSVTLPIDVQLGEHY